MIVTITLNPCIDKTISVSNFTYGGTNSIEHERDDISGKGINVSIVLKHLGLATKCVGFNFYEDKLLVEQALKSKNIEYDFIEAEGSLRTNIKIFDESRRIMTECNSKGTEINGKITQLFIRKIDTLISGMDSSDLLVVDGSVPKGISTDIYKIITEMAHEKGIRTIMDATGLLLKEGIKAKPYAIKPNKDEFEILFSKKMDTIDDLVCAAKALVEKGITYVCVSLGKRGAILVTENSVLYAEGMKLNIKGIQGAGDSLVAGMCAAFYNGGSDEDILRSAVAAASGSLLHEGTQLCTEADFADLYSKVRISCL